MLINKRPIAFKSALNNDFQDEVPVPLTPELIVKGYDVPCISIVPQLNSSDEDDSWEYSDEMLNDKQKYIFSQFQKLKKVRSNLQKVYRDEFVSNLMNQSTDRKNRYSKNTHKALKVGDVVSIKDKFSKPFGYPLGIVLKVETNELNEVTSAHIRKANGEIIRRHVDNVIFLTESSFNTDSLDFAEGADAAANPPLPVKRNKRVAAKKCEDRNRALFNKLEVENLVDLNNHSTTTTCLACLQLLNEWDSGGSLYR